MTFVGDCRQSDTDVDQLNQGLGDMSLNSDGFNGWEDSTKGYITGDGSRRNWATWNQAKAKNSGKWGDDVVENDDKDEIDGSDDELFSDDYDSDDSDKSHDSRKKNPWFAEFFETLNVLTAEQINEPDRQWHCLACQNGPGAIHWYRGMKSFVTHVKTKLTRRPKLHRDLAELLDEELCRKGAVVVQTSETYGQWKGLDKDTEDWKIVWPPMVIVMNTQLEKDENEKWLGMGPQELLDYFDSYEAVKARHSFGPEGHRGISVLIFDKSALGYLEAERLSNHFKRQGLDRDSWSRHPNLFHFDGKRQLYGFMATTQDLDLFNQHSPGKLKLKLELVSYKEKVVDQLKKLSNDSQELLWYKKKIAKQERSSKALEDEFCLLSQKPRKLEEENKIVRQRMQMYHEQNTEEISNSLFGSKLYINGEVHPISRFQESLVATEGNSESSTRLTQLSTGTVVAKPEDYFLRFMIRNIDDISEVNTETGLTIIATVVAIQVDEGWYYFACRACGKKVERNEIGKGDPFDCAECGGVSDVYGKVRVVVRVQDETGSSSFVLFERHITNLIHRSSAFLMDKIKKDEGHMDFPSEFKILLNKKFVFKIQVSPFNLHNNYQVYTVHRLTDDEGVINEVFKHSPAYEEEKAMKDDSTPTNNAKKGKELLDLSGDNANIIDLESITPSSSFGKRNIELVENTGSIGFSSSKNPVAGNLKIPKMEKLE